jgi:hypothetical protein
VYDGLAFGQTTRPDDYFFWTACLGGRLDGWNRTSAVKGSIMTVHLARRILVFARVQMHVHGDGC